MDFLIVSFLIIATAILLVIEVFIVPGISIAGLSALLCAFYAVYYAFVNISTVAGILTIAALLVVAAASIVLFMKSKILDRLALKKNITSTIEKTNTANLKAGDKGVTTTRLALIGYASFDGNIVEVKAANDFIDPNTPVIVERIVDGVILVEKENK